MPGKFKCSTCAREYTWKPELAGRRGKCKCGAAVIVPTEDPEKAVPPEVSIVESQEATPPPVVAHVAVLPKVSAPVPIPVEVAEPTPAVPQVVEQAMPSPQATTPVSVAMPEPAESISVASPVDASPVAVAAADEIPNIGGQTRCQICGATAPTKHVEFHQNIGMLIMRAASHPPRRPLQKLHQPKLLEDDRNHASRRLG